MVLLLSWIASRSATWHARTPASEQVTREARVLEAHSVYAIESVTNCWTEYT